MFFGVGKSGSPICKCIMLLPSASSALAFARTSNAVYVPSLDIPSANFILVVYFILVKSVLLFSLKNYSYLGFRIVGFGFYYM